MKLFAYCLFITTTLCVANDITNHPVDFQTAMGKNHPLYSHYYIKGTQTAAAQNMLTHFQALYNKNISTNSAPQATPKIPKIIHQIWLGSPLPEKFKNLAATWQQHHPDWEYKLWTDADIAALGLENQAAYDTAINYAERSDIARYEILYRFGGLYVDTDFECVQPFDVLHYSYDFYTGLELPGMAMFLAPIIIPNGLIGSISGHPIVRTCIDGIKNDKSAEQNIVIKTGPMLFTQAVLDLASTGTTTDIVFPASFFYPIDKETKDRSTIENIIKPETFALHHWAGSWILKEEAFVPGIKIRSRIEGNIIKFTIIDERMKE
ncbi:MAG: glycosyltransferase [Candidatus Dependentiae bacterium]|nr:glycosyltransferase [Candidatus Dependentiae bacterium]